MSLATMTDVAAKPKRRVATKSTKPQTTKSVKKGVYLAPDNARRLGLTSVMEGVDESSIINALIEANLRKYVVSVRNDRAAQETPAVEDDLSSSSAA